MAYNEKLELLQLDEINKLSNWVPESWSAGIDAAFWSVEYQMSVLIKGKSYIEVDDKFNISEIKDLSSLLPESWQQPILNTRRLEEASSSTIIAPISLASSDQYKGAYSQKCDPGYATASPHLTRFQPKECVKCSDIYYTSHGDPDELYNEFVAIQVCGDKFFVHEESVSYEHSGFEHNFVIIGSVLFILLLLTAIFSWLCNKCSTDKLLEKKEDIMGEKNFQEKDNEGKIVLQYDVIRSRSPRLENLGSNVIIEEKMKEIVN